MATDIGSDPTWIIEAADPEVGIFGDMIIHDCDANVDVSEQATTDVAMRTSADGTMVDATTTFTCPADGATATMVESWPVSMFTEPGRE